MRYNYEHGPSSLHDPSELPEQRCSGQLDDLLGEGLVVCQCGCGSSCRAHGGERGVHARWLGGLRYKWRRLRRRRRHRRQWYEWWCQLLWCEQRYGERQCGWRMRGGWGPYRCMAGDISSASGYATADESLATGSTWYGSIVSSRLEITVPVFLLIL